MLPISWAIMSPDGSVPTRGADRRALEPCAIRAGLDGGEGRGGGEQLQSAVAWRRLGDSAGAAQSSTKGGGGGAKEQLTCWRGLLEHLRRSSLSACAPPRSHPRCLQPHCLARTSLWLQQLLRDPRSQSGWRRAAVIRPRLPMLPPWSSPRCRHRLMLPRLHWKPRGRLSSEIGTYPLRGSLSQTDRLLHWTPSIRLLWGSPVAAATEVLAVVQSAEQRGSSSQKRKKTTCARKCRKTALGIRFLNAAKTTLEFAEGPGTRDAGPVIVGCRINFLRVREQCRRESPSSTAPQSNGIKHKLMTTDNPSNRLFLSSL